MQANIPIWFFALNVFTACFGMIYYFLHACGVKKTDLPIMKAIIVMSFISCGITLFLSYVMLYQTAKYTSAFLFFSWFSVFVSMPFLKVPRVLRRKEYEHATNQALFEQKNPPIGRVYARSKHTS